jgi:hypothetical protein
VLLLLSLELLLLLLSLLLLLLFIYIERVMEINGWWKKNLMFDWWKKLTNQKKRELV